MPTGYLSREHEADGKDHDLYNKVKLYVLYTQSNENKKITEQIEHHQFFACVYHLQMYEETITRTYIC